MLYLSYAGPVRVTALEAGMPLAVLAEIGGGALVAVVGGGAVIISEAAGLVAGTVIVEIADRVGQPVPLLIAIVAVMVMMDSGFREVGCDGDRGQQDGGGEKL